MGAQESATTLSHRENPTPFKDSPRNIIYAGPRLLQIAANEPSSGCCEMLTRFGFRRKMLYLCTREVEEAFCTGASSIFFEKSARKINIS